MKNQNSPLPPLLLRLFEQIECCGDESVILRQEDIPTADKALLASMIKQGLLTDGLAQTVACISCDGIAEISRSGPQGKKITAVCGECASVFPVTPRDLIEYRTDWQALVLWAAAILGTSSESEELSENAAYLGNSYIGDAEYEIFIARQLTPAKSAEIYKAIVQTLSPNKIGGVYSLSPRPTESGNKQLSVIHLAHAIAVSKGGVISVQKAAISDRVKNPAKQAAGHARAGKDPAQKRKELLKGHIRKNITGKYRDMYHHKIKAKILAAQKELIQYTTRDGQIKLLSGQMVLDAVSEVMVELHMPEWINGKAHTR